MLGLGLGLELELELELGLESASIQRTNFYFLLLEQYPPMSQYADEVSRHGSPKSIYNMPT